MSKLSDRIAKERRDFEQIERLARFNDRDERINKKKNDSRRHYIIGEIFTKCVVGAVDIPVYTGWGSKAKNRESFKPLEDFITVFATDVEVRELLKTKIDCTWLGW